MSRFYVPRASDLSWVQGFGAINFANLASAALVPGPSDSTAVNHAASDSCGVCFPSSGGRLSRFSLFCTTGPATVDMNWFVRVNGVDTLLGVLLTGARVLEVAFALTLPPLATGYQLKSIFATVLGGLAGNTATRPRATLRGFVNG